MIRILIACSIVLGLTAPSPAEEAWGTLTFHIRCVDLPEIVLTNDESLIVCPKNGGLANAMVVLREVDRIHPSYEAAKQIPVEIQLVKGRIVPRVAIVRTEQKLILKCTDANAAFNPAYSPGRGNMGNSNLLSPGTTIEHEYRYPTTLPCEIKCPLNPKSKAFLQILDHPYSSASGHDGRITIANVPVGKRELRFWHERAQHGTRWQQDGRDWTSERGNVAITIRPGMNDLGTVDVSYHKLTRKDR